MGAVLKVLSNPVIAKVANKVIDKVFRRAGDASVSGKVSGAAASGTIVTLVITLLAIFEPGLAAELEGLDLAAVVAGVLTVIQTVVGFYREAFEEDN